MYIMRKDSLNVQVQEQDANEVISFTVPKGLISSEHIESFIEFIQKNEAPRVSKSLLNIYFTAISDEYFEMDEEEKFNFENVLNFLNDLSCKYKHA